MAWMAAYWMGAQMTDTAKLRSAITGLLQFTAEAEESLLARAVAADGDGPGRWAAWPAVAHNAEFKHQQVQRLAAVLAGQAPPEFGEIDHSSPAVYHGYAARPAEQVASESARITAALIHSLAVVADEDLLDPSRNPWLRGRPLWLQTIVRGFWHPAGHIGDYYLQHGEPDRALEFQASAVATAAELGAPGPAEGMACYLLGCTQALLGRRADAAASLGRAVRLNPDLHARLRTEPDLAALRAEGGLAALLQ
jgi:hypothetical protein